MHYPGPEPLDFEDVNALNRAFLDLVQNDCGAPQYLRGLPAELQHRIRALSTGQSTRLASAPFLLFSFRERDRRFWDEIHDGRLHPDLFAGARPSETSGRLIAATLGFAWQLARQNPYALRLVCGASLYWCERIADQPLVQIIEKAACRDDLLGLRAAYETDIWKKLLYGGVHVRENLRVAAQVSALQTMLTQPSRRPAAAWATAACRSRFPSLGVAEDGGD